MVGISGTDFDQQFSQFLYAECFEIFCIERRFGCHEIKAIRLMHS
ncbi:hypothetical protein CES86_5731 [Brucella lupini]|uniref:Uncharacterized protein n=1 Tax=Brucella lupini TaxID=255457 RepID=A0A256H0R0_9HYPH|nr:hypothetical protein CES86_5731 [Brucella lupini]